MFSCFLASKLAIVCLVTFPGTKKVECIEVGNYELCVDTHLDTECYQESAFEWYNEFGDTLPLVGMMDTINNSCQE